MKWDVIRSDPFVAQVARFLDGNVPIAPASTVVVAVSGGADSVGLLGVMRAVQSDPRRGYRLIVAHLNHSLRAGSGEDARFVEELARRWELPCVVESRDVRGEAGRLGLGIEQGARKIRYEFLREVAETHSAGYVALAHHRDDNVETILHRIIRGTHLRGLGGIPVVRALGESDVLVIRPLLRCTRGEIESFCERNGFSWRIDPTNADVAFRRNYIRHELLPLLRAHLNPRVDEAILRLGESGGEVEEFLSSLAQTALQQALVDSDPRRIVLDLAILRAQPRLVTVYTLRAALERLAVPMRMMSTERFDDLRGLIESGAPSGVCLPGGVTVSSQGDRIVLETPANHTPTEAAVLQYPGTTCLSDGREIVCEIREMDTDQFNAHCAEHPPGVELVDSDGISGALTVRPRRDGDAFVPLGAPGRQSVSNFLTNLKLLPYQREQILCILDKLGIIYVAPLRIDDRVRIGEATRRILRIELRGGAESCHGYE